MGRTIWGSLDPFYEPGPVLGRRVANTHFLRFLLRADPYDEYHFFLADAAQREALAEHLDRTAHAPRSEGRVRILDARALPRALAEADYHCLHLSDCIRHQPHAARLRNLHSKRLFPVTGPIHSLSYADFAPAFLAHLWPGACERDAIVCTSGPGMGVVQGFFDALRTGYGLDEAAYPAPRLEHIPLGIDPDALVPPVERGADGPVTLLVLGRLSHYSKMDLLPLLRAVQRLFAAGADPASLRLVLAGWVDDEDELPDILTRLAANIGLELTVEARPTEAAKLRLLAEADVFVSIADNPQETFGITVVEAMAMGLPVVASEYDGYRDLVVHEETGLLVSTIGPALTTGLDALAPVLPDNQYHLLLAQQTAVDVPALAEALGRLVADAGLRGRLGAAGRERAMQRYTWPGIIEQYAALWERLNAAPVADEERVRAARHPLHLPYGPLFGHYTTRVLAPGLALVAGRTGRAVYRGQERPILYAGLEQTLDPEALEKLAFFARRPTPAADLEARLAEAFPALTPEAARAHLLWALKHDLLAIAYDDGQANG